MYGDGRMVSSACAQQFRTDIMRFFAATAAAENAMHEARKPMPDLKREQDDGNDAAGAA
jgi:hypothetical protein